MNKLVILLAFSFVITGCATGMANNNMAEKNVTNIVYLNKDFEKSAAVELSASVNILNTTTGADTPTDEASEKVSKIANAIVSLFDDKGKFINTFNLKKVTPTIKGEILKFSAGFVPVDIGHINFKFVFSDANDKVFYETSNKIEIKAKSIIKMNGQLNQVSAKKDPQAPETLNVNINEMNENSYVPNQLIIGLKDEMKDNDLKSLLEKNGIKVTEIKKGILKNYTVTFSAPSVAESLIITNKINQFDYSEPNGIVSIAF